MRRLARLAPRATRSYNFASGQYNAAFGALPPVDRDTLRRDALAYVERFDARSWYDDPVATHVGDSVPTRHDMTMQMGCFDARAGCHAT